MSLPIDPLLPDISRALDERGVAVLSAATGSGKTTRVPPALLDAAPEGRILVVQPRRVAARAAAAWVASQRREQPGQSVGHAVRFDTRGGPKTRLWFITPGVLLRRLVADPFLDGVHTVVVDEVHERTLDLDLCLLLLRHVRGEVREDLRLLAMSATADTQALSTFLDGAPVLDVPGRSFPVEVRYLPRPDDRRLGARVADGVRRMLSQTDGDVLAFLPGAPEIRWTQQALGRVPDVDVVALHGRLPAADQDAALCPGPRRRVVLATNVAETSLTIPGVTGVVDAGLVKRLRHDPRTGLDRLETEATSQASADQRSGRAGRLGPGHALRLWTEASHQRLDAFDPPEIQRVDLSGAILTLRAFGEPDPAALRWPEAPSSDRLEAAEALLAMLGAVRDGQLTEDGEAMSHMPLSPRAARALLEGARRGAASQTARALALLTERSSLRRDGAAPASSDGDLTDMVEAVERHGTQGWHPTSPRALATTRRVADRLAGIAKPHRRPGHDDRAVARALFAGWPDRLAQRRVDGEDRLLLVTGRGARLHPHSAVRDAPWLLALDVDGAGPEARVRLAEAVDEAWLAPTASIEVRWDPQDDRVRAQRVRRLGAIVLDAQATGDAPPSAYAQALVDAAGQVDANRWLPTGSGTNPWRRLRARVRFVARERPDLELPNVTDEGLRTAIPEVTPDGRRLADVARADWSGWLLGQLSWSQRTTLDRLAPERLTVPSGRSIALDYPEDDSPPVLAVRMQEMFGATETPKVAGVPVILHLLAPNGRPQQITDDLDGFWDRAWPEIRRDLRGRYPKHDWPEDPRSAAPARRPRRR